MGKREAAEKGDFADGQWRVNVHAMTRSPAPDRA